MEKKIGNITYGNSISSTVYAILRGVVIVGTLIALTLYIFYTLNIFYNN